MQYKNILVHLEANNSNTHALDVAIQLGVEHDAHLSGVYVSPYPTMPVYMESRLPAKLIQEMENAEVRKASDTEKLFSEKCQSAGIQYSWQNPRGEPVAELIALSHYADLLIMSQQGSIQDSRTPHHIETSVILGAARPAMIVPYIGVSQSPGKRILVAWNDSREATRAVNDAMPMLVNADLVEVMTVSDEEGELYRPTDMALYLARHGVSCEASAVVKGDLSPAHYVLNRATDHDMDTIVMGAYGHSRLRELVLGGDSRTMLQQMTVPVLMSH